MIVVDTSVWIAALRGRTSREATAVAALVDADEVALPIVVRIELLSGASRTDRPRLRRALSALPVVYPGDATWSCIDGWIEAAANANERFGFGDLLIAALTRDLGALLWSLDADFARMARLGFVDLYEP